MSGMRKKQGADSSAIGLADAEEWTQSLGQVAGGTWRQIALAKRLGVPQALGLSVDEWVNKRLGGYVRMAVEDRRAAVAELAADGHSPRESGEVRGVSHETARQDAAGKNLTAPEDDTQADGDAAGKNLTAVDPPRWDGTRAASEELPEQQSDERWTDDERKRRALVESGLSVVANQKVDENLIQWATFKDLAARVDRKSKWGNPFEMGPDGSRDEVCEHFEVFWNMKPSLRKDIGELRGKVLLCWCHPERCHGHFLSGLANAD